MSASKRCWALQTLSRGVGEWLQHSWCRWFMVPVLLGLSANRGRQRPGKTLDLKTQGAGFSAVRRRAASSVAARQI